jgi:hypothetical protein
MRAFLFPGWNVCLREAGAEAGVCAHWYNWGLIALFLNC